jgi:hypothetical protein
VDRSAANADRRGVLAAGVAFTLFALNFGAYRVFGDGVDYYSFVQRLFGDRRTGSGYNFGTGLLNAPFYALGLVAKAAAGGGRLAAHALPASITFASITYALVALVVSAWVVGRLGLRNRGAAALAAVFGTPVWYYASFSPAYSHAADAAVFSIATAALYLALRRNRLRWFAAFGAALGVAVTVRPYNLGVVAGAIIALAVIRPWRAVAVTAAATAVAFGLLVTIPVALGAGLHTRASGEPVATKYFQFSPLSPLRMLFTPHRGLFVWTPVTALAIVGIVLYLRSRRPDRDFVAVVTAMAAGLLLIYASFSWWDAGWSFSMRFLASPVVFYAIGVAALLSELHGRWRAVAAGATTVCVLWSIFLGMNHAFGASQSDGAFQVATTRGPSAFVHLMWSYSRARHVVDRLP